jgi:hypothetical protein
MIAITSPGVAHGMKLLTKQFLAGRFTPRAVNVSIMNENMTRRAFSLRRRSSKKRVFSPTASLPVRRRMHSMTIASLSD